MRSREQNSGKEKIMKEIIEENVMSWKKDNEFQTERAHLVPSR